MTRPTEIRYWGNQEEEGVSTITKSPIDRTQCKNKKTDIPTVKISIVASH
uniref:Uncharacterized protein n=1 Tax=uncultured marine virus TaxID=186617 RepID=A0A0F7L820_9VIRU|nr:hypothetical protein [uncultured marine virus]